MTVKPKEGNVFLTQYTQFHWLVFGTSYMSTNQELDEYGEPQ